MPMMKKVLAYLDIETTGFSPFQAELTVIGLYVVHGPKHRVFFQPYGDQITSRALSQALSDVDLLYTYNGKKFDLPFIEAKMGLDVTKKCAHQDLLYDCWERGLYGGLKNVERMLRIPRANADINGWMAVQLWHRYAIDGDPSALKRLLDYNREDVMNLEKLREKLSSARSRARSPVST